MTCFFCYYVKLFVYDISFTFFLHRTFPLEQKEIDSLILKFSYFNFVNERKVIILFFIIDLHTSIYLLEPL